jgi:glycosyltransferase involved in cell wall biosynthesis
MKIGIDIKALYSGKAGISNYIKKTLDSLQEIDNSNEYFLFEKKASSYRLKNKNFRKILIPCNLPGTLWLQFILPFYLKKYSIDVFWGPEQLIPCFFTNKIKMLLTVLDLTLFHYPQTMQTTNYWINKLFLKKSIKKAKRIISISEYIKNDLYRIFSNYVENDKITVTHLGVPDIKLEKNRKKNRDDHLLFVGSCEPRKNLLNLLKAIFLLRNKKELYPILHIVGPQGWKNKNIIDFIKKNKLEDQIFFRGYLSNDELIEEYLSCKAFIYPSLYEGFGLPVIEALSCNTLVLASKGIVFDEIAPNCFIPFDPLNPEDIADKINLIYQKNFNEKIYLDKVSNILSKYSWKDTAKKTLDALNLVYNN